jgi:hypothetical protein
MKELLIGLTVIVGISTTVLAQNVQIFNLRNCQGEMRTVTFQSQVKTFNWWVFGTTNLKDQRVFKFSPSYKLDTAYLTKQVKKLKSSLPASFFTQHPFLGDWYDNQPDEPSIWFLQVFASKNQKGVFNVYAAVKIVFDGVSAHSDESRGKAEIKDIKFVFDKQELSNIAKTLEVLKPL